MKRRLITILSLCGLLAHSAAFAHSSSNSFITVTSAVDSSVAGSVTSAVTDEPPSMQLRADLPLRDIELRFDLDRNRDGNITWGELQAQTPEINAWVMSGISLSVRGVPCQMGAPDWALTRISEENYLSLEMPMICSSETAADAVTLRYGLFFDQDELHRALVKVIRGADTTSAVLSPMQPEQQLAAGPSSVLFVFLNYLIEGVWHIWIGLDHILFLLSLLLPCVFIRAPSRIGHWRPVAQLRPALLNVLAVVTAFTIAHSITLSLAVLQILNPPSSVIEPIIAASVVLAALSNLTKGLIHLRWQIALAFGLIHGFGFASVLTDLGLPSDQLVVALLSFNVGVELGQIAIVLAFLPLAWFLRGTAFYRWGLVVGGSVLIAAIATLWLIERLLG